MPVKPQFTWEQTGEDVLLHVTIKGCKKEAVDVLIADVFVKINAPPQYLLALDLLHEIDPAKSTQYFTSAEDAILLHVKLHKAEADLVWDALSVHHSSAGKQALLQRRQESMQRAEQRYGAQLQARVAQRETEKRRMLEAQWDVEKAQRSQIEQRVKAEKDAAESELYAWEDATTAAAATASAPSKPPQSPADLFAPVSSTTTTEAAAAPLASSSACPTAAAAAPSIRQADTVHVSIDFTPKTLAMPTRSRGDEEYYRQSRYKPISIEDTPMFWKERADKCYRAQQWKAAADAYSESIKRDGAFLTCVMNRAACCLQLAEYKKAIEDCSLALTMVANTPASEVTQDRYRGLMTKLYARRGAAYCWADDLKSGIADLRMAAAYRDTASDDGVAADLALIEARAKERGIDVDDAGADPLAIRMQEAATLYHRGSYDAAEAAYTAILAEDPYHVKAQSNLAASLLRAGRFKQALGVCDGIVQLCGEVAAALEEPGGLTADQRDSDDEEDEYEAGWTASEARGGEDGAASNKDALVRRRRAAARKLGEQSGHVYMLLKAYVRSAAALCGMQEYQKAHACLERALRITPYDNDLRDDCNRLAEKIRMNALVAASAGAGRAQRATA
ncbi:CS domain/TPR repeat/Tetratricopeptide repeat [Novymonas esmeraldas]|uniref:Dynein axonemal assembly factor 4 n=1 Tax=Novymonas esmeraldas TaxID=1808958 RepID=A0AAW0F9G2_9TRYP